MTTARAALDAHTDRAVRLVERLTRTTDNREPNLRDLVETRLEMETHALRLRLRAYELRICELLAENDALEVKIRAYRERYESRVRDGELIDLHDAISVLRLS